MVAMTHWVCFLFFRRELSMFSLHISVKCSRGFFVWIAAFLWVLEVYEAFWLLGRFMERSGVFPTIQFAYRKGLAT